MPYKISLNCNENLRKNFWTVLHKMSVEAVSLYQLTKSLTLNMINHSGIIGHQTKLYLT